MDVISHYICDYFLMSLQIGNELQGCWKFWRKG